MLRTNYLSIGYSEPLITGITVEFQEGTLTQVIGANGSGKTTLLKTLVGLVRPLSGKVYLYGMDVTAKPNIVGRHVGYVPQIFTPSYFTYPVSVEEFIEFSYLLYRSKWPRIFSDGLARERVDEVLRLVDLDADIKHKSFWSLSGGQRQRVLVARALIHNPKLLVLDEPFSSVDPVGKVSLASTLVKLFKEKNVTIIISSHDPTLLLPHTDNVLLLGNGEWFFGRSDEVLHEEILRRVYGTAVSIHEKHIHIHDYHV
ncbi:MAG: metal ABC transporter ATP-binding protein [Zestosphaera sp.]